VRDGESGLLVPHADPGSLAEVLLRVLGDPDLRRRLTAGGLAWSARFTWERSAEEAWRVAEAAAARREIPDPEAMANPPSRDFSSRPAASGNDVSETSVGPPVRQRTA
jgi:hypothetical protein